jgi:hypothetical protein
MPRPPLGPMAANTAARSVLFASNSGIFQSDGWFLDPNSANLTGGIVGHVTWPQNLKKLIDFQHSDLSAREPEQAPGGHGAAQIRNPWKPVFDRPRKATLGSLEVHVIDQNDMAREKLGQEIARAASSEARCRGIFGVIRHHFDGAGRNLHGACFHLPADEVSGATRATPGGAGARSPAFLAH